MVWLIESAPAHSKVNFSLFEKAPRHLAGVEGIVRHPLLREEAVLRGQARGDIIC